MPVLNRVVDVQSEIAEWRRDFHAHPELLYAVHRTAARVASLLESFGVDEIVAGIGRSGVVGVIRGRGTGEGRVLALRADMDALPIAERTGKPYASVNAGTMHACGHDGHMAMLLGAARHLAQTRDFDGTIVLVFQPAEEGGGGGLAMVEDGLVDRFGIDEFYGMHNLPGLPVGHFAIREGAFTAATDRFGITISGEGGHAALPHLTLDPIVAGCALVSGLQSIVTRQIDSLSPSVLSVTQFHAGSADNVIADAASITGSVRTVDAGVQSQIEEAIARQCEGVRQAYGLAVDYSYTRGYPSCVNEPATTERAIGAARTVVGSEAVATQYPPMMFGEDFSYFQRERPGALILLGNGDSANLHTPSYDFCDEAIAYGVSYWIAVAQGRSVAP